MNFYATLVALAAMIGCVAAEISFNMPRYNEAWFTKSQNYLNIISSDPLEQYATVRFSNANECMTLTVKVNHVIPIVLPRPLRACSYLNLYAVSNRYSTAYTSVNVVDNLCKTAGDLCIKPCAPRGRGCTIFSEELGGSGSEQASCAAEATYIAYDSEEANKLNAQQILAAQHLADDIKLLQPHKDEQEQQASVAQQVEEVKA